jgi:cell wall-associated NlpC family hydrolase
MPGRAPLAGRRPTLVLIAVAVAAGLIGLAWLVTGGDGRHTAATGTSAAPKGEIDLTTSTLTPAQRRAIATGARRESLKTHPQLVKVAGVGTGDFGEPDQAASSSSGGPTAPSDAEVRRELNSFRHFLASAPGVPVGAAASVQADGSAVAPVDAPSVVAAVIQAGNAIAKTPYKWGGGHGRWADTGYDCSGSVSFALAGAGLLASPLDSTGFESWGASGPGRWITVYANAGHAFMVVAGLRFDTSGRGGPRGTRWQPAQRSVAGFVARHPPGL